MRRKLSLTLRLTALYALISSIVLSVLGVIIVSFLKSHFIEQDREELLAKQQSVVSIVRQTLADNKIGSLAARLDTGLNGHKDLIVQVKNSAAQRLFLFPKDYLKSASVTQNTDSAEQDLLLSHAQLQGNNDLLSALTVVENSVQSLQVFVAINANSHDAFMSRFQRSLIYYIVITALISGLLGWVVTKRGLLPLYLIKQHTLGISAKQLNQRMSSERLPIELSDLIVALNQMLERLDNSFKRLSEFSNDIAHELRTPVTNLLTQTQVAISRPRDTDTYENILASNAEELQQLSKMIADMLFLAKADHSFSLPSSSEIDLATEINALFEFYEALAEEQQVTLQLTGCGSIVGDRLMIRRAINNLLSNAIRHTPVNSVIKFSIQASGDGLTLAVENPGTTILPADIPYLFERFYRSNKTRSRHNAEGTGLGLAITQAIVKAHSGEISVTSAAGVTCFAMVFKQHITAGKG